MRYPPPLILSYLIAGLLLVACAGQRPVPSPAGATSAPSPTPGPTQAAATPPPLDDAATRQLMQDLLSASGRVAEPALEQLLAAGDRRFIPVLIELVRAHQIGIVRPYRSAYLAALETLSGQSFGDNWAAWVEWYGGTDLAPPPGFTGWKGSILARIDPAFADFFDDAAPAQLRVEEIQWGGVVVDGIPALDNPLHVPAAAAGYLEPDDAVFGLTINGDARAYPLRIMDWHEMANDIVGGVPVSLAYCTLCGAAIAFDGRASDGETYTFGSSGMLYRSNKLMYDRSTRTLWNQLTGEPVLGELAATGVQLSLLPVVLTTWGDWQAQHPDSLVLALQTGYRRDYSAGAAYGDYFSAANTMFPVWQRSELLPAKAQVYALRIDGRPKAYPIDRLTSEQVVNDSLGDANLVLIAAPRPVTVDGQSWRAGAVSYAAGAEVRAYDRGDHTFRPGPDPMTVLDEQERPWQVTESALAGPDGATAPRISGHLAYWFGWYAFFPQTELYGAGE